MKGPIADDFVSSAGWVVTLAGRVEPDQWDRSALGNWNVRSLLGHAARAMSTVEEYLDRPAAQVDTPTSVAYMTMATTADPSAIAARGVSAGLELGDEPARRVSELHDRVSDLLRSTSPTALLSTAAGGMTLETYLPTRTVELVVHGCDLATAIGADPDPPAEAAAATARLLTEVYVATGRSATVCTALSGRPIDPSRLALWPSS
jgi:uncharacterized protein (TIGR03083 family)